MRLGAIKRIYANSDSFADAARKLTELHGEKVHGNEIRRAIATGILSPKLRRLGEKKRHRYCFEFRSASERDLFAEIVEKLGGQKAILNILLPDD